MTTTNHESWSDEVARNIAANDRRRVLGNTLVNPPVRYQSELVKLGLREPQKRQVCCECFVTTTNYTTETFPETRTFGSPCTGDETAVRRFHHCRDTAACKARQVGA